MTTVMSTPISQLPKSGNTGTFAEEDPSVSEVISQMEKEFSQSQPPPQPPQHFQAQPLPQQPPQLQQPSQQPLPLPQQPKNLSYIDTSLLKRAFIAAFIAFIIFYPCEFGFIYEKYNMLKTAQPYERVIRALLLAVLLYVIMLKMDSN